MRRLLPPQLLQPRVAPAAGAVVLVAHRVFLVVVLVIVLGRVKRAALHELGDDGVLERLGLLMKQAASLDMTLPMLLPGINVKTGPDDFYPIEREQMSRFTGKTRELFGKVYGR
jgi:hypothetical protein